MNSNRTTTTSWLVKISKWPWPWQNGAVLDVDHAEQIDMTHTSRSRTSTRYHIFADPQVFDHHSYLVWNPVLIFVSRHALSRGTRTRPDVVAFLCNVMRLVMFNEE